MTTTRKLAAALALVSTLAACAGRTAQPIATALATDADLACSSINAEIAANSTKITETQQERISNRNDNLMIGVAGAVFFWPALLALDVGNHEEVEINALERRNDHLQMIAGQQGCYAKIAQG
jgi:hypothetical protein